MCKEGAERGEKRREQTDRYIGETLEATIRRNLALEVLSRPYPDHGRYPAKIRKEGDCGATVGDLSKALKSNAVHSWHGREGEQRAW